MAQAHRYFFCLRPPAGEAKRIGIARDQLEGRGTKVADERLHVTLGISNDYPEHAPHIVERLMAIGSAIDAEPFAIGFDRLSGSGSTVALCPSKAPRGLGILQRQIGRQLVYWDLQRLGWAFSPHITLMYRTGQPFIRPSPLFEWTAAELVLVHSLIGETKHIDIGRWPLVQRQMDLLAL
jgi:2'-5' RNA ligase